MATLKTYYEMHPEGNISIPQSSGLKTYEQMRADEREKTKAALTNSHNIFTLSTLPLGASQDDIYRTKYKGKSFNELNVMLRDMDEGTEKDWLTQYANSPEVMTQKDYENAISIAENQIKWYQENGELINPDDRVGAWNEYYREIEALEDEIENLRAGHWQRGNMDKYGNLSANADYARLSGTVADERTSGKWNIGGDKVYDYINDIDGYREYIAAGGRNMNASGGAAPFLKYDNMTDEEISDYNYIYQKEGREAAEKYLDWLSYQLDAKQRGVERGRAAELATEHPGIASIASIPANLASGAGLVDVALQQAGRALTGEYKPINYNRAAMAANTFSTGVRETVAQNIVDSSGVISIDSNAHPILAKVLNGKSWADVYNLGMSMADSATIAAMSPVLGKAGTWLLGGAAGTQGMLDALERGGTDEQALFMGMLNGTFEALFERISLDKLLSGNSRNLITAMLKQGFIEGSEELNTSFFNNVADILIMAENSNYEKNIAAYIESGLDPEEARKQALWDAAIEMGWDFIGGVVSGGIMGGGRYTVGSVNARNEQLVNTYGEYTQELAQQGLELKPGNRFAQRMLDRAEAGKDLSAGQIGRLVRQNEKAINANDVTLIRQAAENRLKELGETGDVSELAKVLAKRAQGKALSRAERNLLDESRYGNRVANELNAANIESGEFSTGWAENIGTERINARQYNKGTEESSGQQSAITEEQQKKPTVAPQNIKTVGQQTEADNRQEAAKAPAELSNDRSEQSLSQPAADSSLYTREPEISAEEAEDIEEQEGTVHDADTAYKLVQDMGRTGADLLEYAKGGVASRYLSEEQIEAAYSAGKKASDTDARTKDENNRAKATGGTGRVEGTVRGDGVTIGDIDSFASEKFNSPQKRGYRILSAYAKATGINIVLYNSASPNATDEQKANTGKFDPKDSTMYIDINSGFALGESLDNMGKFALVRTFGHEFVHFIEKYNAAEYNELRRFVFDTLKERGENVAELIEEKRLAFNGEMSYDAASREVVAEALTDILPDSSLMQNMAEQHKGVFRSLVDKLKEFVADIKAYFAELKTPASREARALQDEIDGSIRYLEELVKKYDEIAAKAVENYQATVATAEVETVAETVATAETEDTTAEKATQDTLEENESKPKVSTSKNGYTVTDNPEYNSVDVKFPGKPSEVIRNALKANGFRWNGKRGVWYGKMSHEDAMAIIDKAYEDEMWAPPEVPTQTENIEPAAEAEADNRQETAKVPAEPANDEESTEKVEDIPPKAETEEAKQELRKAVRMPIKGTNMEALLQGIKSKELSLDSISLPGKVEGFNAVQREYLVEALIKGVYTDSASIKVAVPYDGKFEIENTPGNVAKVLDSLKVQVTQEIIFDKSTINALSRHGKIFTVTIDGQTFATNGYLLLPVDKAAKEYLEAEHKAEHKNLPQSSIDMYTGANKTINLAPVEGKLNKIAVYEFEIDGKKRYFNKSMFKFIDGGTLYINPAGTLIKSVDAEGNSLGALMAIEVPKNNSMEGVKPSALKSFAGKKMTSPAKAEEVREKKPKPEKPAKSKELVTDETVKLDDFGEKIGGARKDLWSSRGLEVSDLEDMNDRERDKHVKKDNVWKRPDYVKLAEGGADKGLLYMQNEIRKSLPQNITYRRNETEESRRERQELFIQTVRQIEVLAKNVQTAAELEKIGYAWGLENGYLEKTGSTYQPYKLTNKYYSNPALSGSSYFQTVANLAKKFRNLKTIAEKEGFAADAKSKVPKGYSIVEDNKGAWFIAKGSFIIKGDIASYDEALSMLKGALESKKRKTRFVPQQLLAVHRRGPNYRHGDNVEGNDYIDTFGFKGGEFGNWMSAKDRQVSLNYGFDALKDLAFALGIADTDISFGGKLSIAFGARGQGLSGASAHYEQDRQVINLTKMNGAGSLAHEWFHGLDDFMGGFKLKMGSDNVRSLPEKTQQAMRSLISTMQYRDETQEETDLRATKLFEQAQKNLKRTVENQFPWVKTLRAGDTEQVELLFPYYKRTPDSSDLAKFEAELSALVETGEMKHASNLSALRKEIQGHVIAKEDMNNIGFYAIGVKNAGEGVQRGRVRTDFYNDSRRFGELHSKDGDYWDSTVEMAARAFACYVADKTGKNNDYLTGHAEAAFTLDTDAKGNVRVIRAYPVGAERAAINEAFDELIAAMKEDGYLHDRVQEPTPEEVQYQARDYLSNEAERFRADIDAWDKDGRLDGETFILGSTGNVLQGLGAIESDVYMLSDKVNTIFKDHPEMTVKEIKNLPEILENPVLVLASQNAWKAKENTRLVVFGMVKAQNKLPVMTVFDLRPIENKIYLSDMQKVSSAYTKDKTPTATIDLIRSSDVLYADKEKTTALLHSVGFQHAYSVERSGYMGNISYVGKTVNVSGVKFSDIFTEEADQYQFRVKSLTDREVLQLASKELKEQDLNMSEAERDALRIISDRLTKLQELETERREAGQLYRQQQFGPGVDREAAKATLERMHNLDRKIEQAESAVFRAENAGTVKRIVKRARKIAEDKDRAEMREAIKRMNDRRDNSAAIKKYRNRIKADVTAMSEWVIHPNNKNVIKHVPDVLKSTVIPFITSIDMTSKRQLDGGAATKADEVFVKRLEAVQKKLGNAGTVEGRYSEYGDLPPDFAKRLNGFVDKVKAITENTGSFQINKMDSAELKELSEIVRNLKKAITEVNVYHANAVYQHVYEGGDNSIDYLKGMKAADAANRATNFVMWQNMRPAYAFERFGKGGEAIYDGLRRGQAQLAFNTEKLIKFSEDAYTEAEVKAWEDKVKTFTLGGDKVRMRVADIMSLYELAKRPKALEHILGDGIRVAKFDTKGSDRGHVITSDEIETITDSLTERQKEVADTLQKYMAEQGGKWGNHVTVKRWGVEVFGEEHYFPINSDDRLLPARMETTPANASLYALLNMGFTKELKEGADNRIVLYSIFDVFSNHMSSMAQYNALALPVLDAVKWFNFSRKGEDGARTESLREQMARVYGAPVQENGKEGKGYAVSFVENVIRAFNGTEAQGAATDSFGTNALRRYNVAQVGYNLRTIVQQPLSIMRAALLVDYDSIAKGMSPAQSAKNIEEMRKYSGIAVWKSLGFYDTNISRGVSSIVKHNENWVDKVNETGMKGAEFADKVTWGGIWGACKAQVSKTGLKPGDDGFYEAVTKLFEDVIYKTQVVDSVLTKAEYQRSKGFFSRAISSFMSEPIATASMLLSAADKFNRDMQQGMTRQEAWIRNRDYIVRVSYVYAIGQTLLAAVQAIADAFRDDDEYQNFWEKWLEAFGGNLIDELVPVNKLPILSDFWELAKSLLEKMGVDTYGNAPRSLTMQWRDTLLKGTEILWDKISGKETDYTWYAAAYKLLQTVSGITGLPMAAATREAVTLWNNSVGHFVPSLRIRSYEPSETAQIKYAYQDGYLTAEEATAELLEKGIAQDENDAYWYIQEWESKDSRYSRYADIYDAVRNGGDFTGAMQELTSHGYTEKQVKSQIKSQIGTWYRDGEISKQQAISMLSKYIGMDSEEITKDVNKWSAKVVTGIAYDDIKDEYLAGNITAVRAAEMYVLYGGMSKEKAKAVIEVYDWQRQGYDYATEASIRDYKEYCQSSNVPKDVYLAIREYANNTENDKDEDGKTISYSAMKKIMAKIDSYNLTAEQKTAIAKSLGWSDKNIDKYKLW